MSEPVNPTARDKARYRLASAVDGGDPNAVAMAVDELIEAHLAEPHGDVHAPCAKLLAEEGRTKYLSGYGDGERAAGTRIAERMEADAARVEALGGPDDAQATLSAVARVLRHEVARIRDPQGHSAPFVGGRAEPGPATASVDTHSVYPRGSACANGHDWHWQHEAPVHTRVWCRRCKRYPEHVADDLLTRLADAHAKLEHDVKEAERGFARMLAKVSAERDANKAGWNAAVADLLAAKKDLLATKEALLDLWTKIASVYEPDVATPTGCTNPAHKQPCEFGCGK